MNTTSTSCYTSGNSFSFSIENESETYLKNIEKLLEKVVSKQKEESKPLKDITRLLEKVIDLLEPKEEADEFVVIEESTEFPDGNRTKRSITCTHAPFSKIDYCRDCTGKTIDDLLSLFGGDKNALEKAMKLSGCPDLCIDNSNVPEIIHYIFRGNYIEHS